MDTFDEDILKFWKVLQDNNVQYIMVGDYAMGLHGFQRYTPLIEIWILDSTTNRGNLRKAFIELEIGDHLMIEQMQFVTGGKDFIFKSGFRLNINTSIKGLENFSFEECLTIAAIAEIKKTNIPFLHINQLIANKKAINSPKDQIEVKELEKIKLLRKESGLDKF